MYGVSELRYVCRGCETGAVRQPAARPFVQDAQGAVRLPVSRSKRSRDRLSGSRTALLASRTNRLAAGRRPASRSRSRGNHTRGQLRHTMHSPPCPNVLRSHAHSPPLLLLSAEATCKPASLAASTARCQMAQCREVYWNCLQSTCYGCVACSEVAYRRNICEFEWSFRSR